MKLHTAIVIPLIHCECKPCHSYIPCDLCLEAAGDRHLTRKTYTQYWERQGSKSHSGCSWYISYPNHLSHDLHSWCGQQCTSIPIKKKQISHQIARSPLALILSLVPGPLQHTEREGDPPHWVHPPLKIHMLYVHKCMEAAHIHTSSANADYLP